MEQRKQRGRSARGRAKHSDATINLSGNATIHTSGRRGRGEGLARGVGEEGGGEKGNKENSDGNVAKERNAERSSASISSEKEAKKPWSLPLL